MRVAERHSDDFDLKEADMARAQAEATTTKDHEQIRRWVEERGGKPAAVRRTGDGDDPGVLRIEFPGYGTEDGGLEHISWDEWFSKFDEEDLAFLYQERTADGDESRFWKIVEG